MRNLLIIDGHKAIKSYQKGYRKELKEYKDIYGSWGITFKKVKPKDAKKPYYYWYKWEYDSEKQNNVWTYLGKDKPNSDIPDPPISRLDDLTYQVVSENIILSEVELQKVQDLFEGHQMFDVSPV